MTVRPILKWPDARLSEVCDPVEGAISPERQDLERLIADMFETMYDAKGRGLAAPQIGEMRRLFVMDTTWKDAPSTPIAMINPELVWSSEEEEPAIEGCLSIPGITTEVTRACAVEFEWTSPEGIRMSRRMEGIEARCALHELDHLDGRVTFDRLTPAARILAENAYGGTNV